MSACGAVLALRVKLIKNPKVRMPLPLLGPHTPENDALTLFMLERSYYTLFPRLNALAFGLMAALVYSDARLMQLFNRCFLVMPCLQFFLSLCLSSWNPPVLLSTPLLIRCPSCSSPDSEPLFTQVPMTCPPPDSVPSRCNSTPLLSRCPSCSVLIRWPCSINS